MKNESMRYINADKLIDQIKLQAGCAKCDSYGGIRCRACPWDDAITIVDDFADNIEKVTKEERV